MPKSVKDKLIVELSNKYGLSQNEVKNAVNSQFRFVARVIAKGNFDSVRLPYFGVFKPNMKQKEHYDKE